MRSSLSTAEHGVWTRPPAYLRAMRSARFAVPLLAASLVAISRSAAQLTSQPRAQQVAQAPCPDGVAAGSRCLTGRDSLGAYFWLVMPAAWNRTLVVHAHGGPELGEPKQSRASEDLTRWSIWTRAGYAYAGTGYHEAGVAVHSAAADLERVRLLFVREFGAPTHTILHGQSWGASVAAVAAESYPTANGRLPYDAVLLSSGVLGGSSQSYDFRFDLRVVYQAVCGNHPRADEPTYPLWVGLPLTATLTRAQLATRVDDCTGVRLDASQRTPQQQRNLDDILGVTHIPERSLIAHLNWGTWHFQDIVFRRLGGRNPFTNDGVRYVGSHDDAALNARVFRTRADSAARADFAADADPQGRIAVPVMTMHGINDPTAFVELESVFRETMRRRGNGARLVQLFSDHDDHSYLSDAQYVTAMHELLQWVKRGTRPTPSRIANQCRVVAAAFMPEVGCRFLPNYTPQPLRQRAAAR